MPPPEIKKALIDVGLTVARLARELGRSRQTVYQYLNGAWNDPAQRAAIQAAVSDAARQVGVVPPELWPATDSTPVTQTGAMAPAENRKR